MILTCILPAQNSHICAMFDMFNEMFNQVISLTKTDIADNKFPGLAWPFI